MNMSIGEIISYGVIVCLILSLIALGYSSWRIRQIFGRIGAFPCTIRIANNRTLEGIGVFGARDLSFYKLRAWSRQPLFCWRRSQIEVLGHKVVGSHLTATAERRHKKSLPVEENIRLMAVKIKLNGKDCTLFLHSDAFAAIVSWIDAAGPSEEPRLY